MSYFYKSNKFCYIFFRSIKRKAQQNKQINVIFKSKEKLNTIDKSNSILMKTMMNSIELTSLHLVVED